MNLSVSLGGFLGVLTLVFVIAKLWGVISWSWWLVFLPAIISVSMGLSVLLFIIIIFIFWGFR